MAKQRGAIVLDGKIGGLIFYKTKYGTLARNGWEISKDKLKNSPSYAGRRDNNTEFGYASRVGKLLRRGVHSCCPLVETGATNFKLAALLLKAVKNDTVNGRGERRLMADNIDMLRGLNWKEDSPVRSVLKAQYELELDVAGGEATLNITSIMPYRDVLLGEGATHVEVVLSLTAIDDDKGEQKATCNKSGMINLTDRTDMTISLNCSLADATGKIWVAGIGIQGYQEVNGEMVGLRGGNGFEIGKAGVK